VSIEPWVVLDRGGKRPDENWQWRASIENGPPPDLGAAHSPRAVPSARKLDHFSSNRSSFITFSQASAKSRTNVSSAPSKA